MSSSLGSTNPDVVVNKPLPTTTAIIPMVLKVYKKNNNGSPNLNKRKAAAAAAAAAKEEEEDYNDYNFLMSRIQKNPRRRIATIDRHVESASSKKDLCSRQLSSFNSCCLDLNIRADEVEEEDDGSPVSSDVTREMNTCMNEISRRPCDHLVRSIKNNFYFNRSPARDKEMKEEIGLKMKASFDEVYGGGGGAHNNHHFGIEDRVLEMVLLGGGDSFVNKVFERWVKEIFKTSLERGKQMMMINMGEENGISFKLCINGAGGDDDNLQGQGQQTRGGGGGGFMGTNLPNNILLREEEHM